MIVHCSAIRSSVVMIKASDAVPDYELSPSYHTRAPSIESARAVTGWELISKNNRGQWWEFVQKPRVYFDHDDTTPLTWVLFDAMVRLMTSVSTLADSVFWLNSITAEMTLS